MTNLTSWVSTSLPERSRAPRHVMSSGGTTSVCFCCRCGAQSVLGARPVHRLPQQAPATEPVPETPSVLGRRLEGSPAEQAPVNITICAWMGNGSCISPHIQYSPVNRLCRSHGSVIYTTAKRIQSFMRDF